MSCYFFEDIPESQNINFALTEKFHTKPPRNFSLYQRKFFLGLIKIFHIVKNFWSFENVSNSPLFTKFLKNDFLYKDFTDSCLVLNRKVQTGSQRDNY